MKGHKLLEVLKLIIFLKNFGVNPTEQISANCWGTSIEEQAQNLASGRYIKQKQVAMSNL